MPESLPAGTVRAALTAYGAPSDVICTCRIMFIDAYFVSPHPVHMYPVTTVSSYASMSVTVSSQAA